MKCNKVILKEDFFFHVQYRKGEIFTIVGEDSIRGWDLKHDKTGKIIYECRFIHDLFDSYNIKEERKDKLKRINN
jgi:hypothetical protein